jgi:hypothetical protein
MTEHDPLPVYGYSWRDLLAFGGPVQSVREVVTIGPRELWTVYRDLRACDFWPRKILWFLVTSPDQTQKLRDWYRIQKMGAWRVE